MTLKEQLSALFLASLFSLSLSGAAVAAPAAHSHEHAMSEASLSLNDGKKWVTDAPLRRGMANIRQAMASSLHAIHEDKLPAAKYKKLAKKLNHEVSGMVSNCKLEPQSDAQLHLILAEILAGIEAMEGKLKQTTARDGAVKVLGALENYGNYFADSNWQAIKH